MLRDWGSWDGDFRAMTADLRRRLLALTGDTNKRVRLRADAGQRHLLRSRRCSASFVPRDGKVLVLANGAYGLRAAQTLQYLGRAYTLIDKGDYMPPRGDEVAAALDADPAITHVVVDPLRDELRHPQPGRRDFARRSTPRAASCWSIR